METGITTTQPNMVSLMADTPLTELIKPLSKEILLFDSYIAGTMHLEDASILDELKEGDKLALQREPENRFDENAIIVLNEKKQKLGYIPEKDNVVFTRLMDAGKYLIARVDTMVTKGSFKQIGIKIYLVDF